MKKDISCDIVRDLLVSYMDGTCSEESRKIVDDHINECSLCKKELENYTSELPGESDRSEKRSASRPFRKIRRKITVLIIILIIIAAAAIPAGIYLSYVSEHSGYEADKKFLRITDEEILSDQNVLFSLGRGRVIYTKMYYALKEKRGENNSDKDINALIEEYNMISNAELDLDNITFYSDDFENSLAIGVPMITPWDSRYRTTVVLVAEWKGPGRYILEDVHLEYEGAYAYGYCYPPLIDLLSDTQEPWPFISHYYNTEIKLSIFGSGKEEIRHEAIYLNDTGKQIKSGIYRWESDDPEYQGRREIIFFDDRTLFFREFNQNKSYASAMRRTSQKSKYCITDTDHITAFGCRNVIQIGKIDEIKENEITINGNTFRLISENVPDDKELEKIINDDINERMNSGK